MADQNKKSIEVVSEQRQASEMSTADIVAATNQRSVDMTYAPERPVPGVPVIGTASPAPLLPANEIGDLRSRWTDIQTGFVDEPRESVEKADALVAEVMKRLAETFAKERSTLEGQWSRGDHVSTEELRMALKHYRSFFDRLLSL